MRGTTVKRLHKIARSQSVNQPDVAYNPSTPVRMVPTCTRRILKTLKQEWKRHKYA